MTHPPPVYDLVVLLDPAIEDSARPKIVADVQGMISSGGELVRHDDWGDRPMAYPIEHKTDAYYHLFQFHSTPALLDQLQRTLRITDGVVRFRIIKLKPGTPEAPDMRSARREPEPAGREPEPAGREPEPAGREPEPTGREPEGREPEPAEAPA